MRFSYHVEEAIRGRDAEQRRQARGSASRPILDAFKPWLETRLGRFSGKSPLATAIRYTLARWPCPDLGSSPYPGRLSALSS